MPDFSAPVAQDVNVNPAQAVQTLSGLLGLKQQQAQIGLIGAEEQQQQQTARQRSALGAFFQNFDPSKHVGPDGTLDLDSTLTDPKLRAAAGDQFPAVAQQLIAVKQNQLTAKQQLVNLNDSTRQQFMGLLGGLRTDPDVIADNPTGRAKVNQAVQQFGSTGPDAARIAQIYGSVISHVPPGRLVQTLSNFQLQAMDAGAQAATQRPQYIPTGAAFVNTNPQAPGGNLGRTPALTQGLPPQVITQPGTGALFVIGGAQGTTPAPIGANGSGRQGAGVNWWQPGPGQTQLLTANTAALAGRIQAGIQAANASPQAIDALTRARTILDQGTWTGGSFSYTKDLRNLVASIGIDTTSAQNASELAKNLARYEAARAGSVGDTDAARSLYEAGAPNTKMDAAAVKAVIEQSLGLEKMIQGYARVVGNAQTPQAAMSAEQQFRSIPNLVKVYELGFMRNAKEAQDFANRYGINLRDLAQSAQQLKQMGAL